MRQEIVNAVSFASWASYERFRKLPSVVKFNESNMHRHDVE